MQISEDQEKTVTKTGYNAIFSPCRRWRYTLTRIWDIDLPLCMFIGLNPSTADEVEDDPTVRRCIGYARDWGYGGIIMTNIFALRSTDPKALYKHYDPIGSENNRWLLDCATERAGIVVAAWGNHGLLYRRGKSVVEMLKKQLVGVTLWCLGKTKQGQPKHPLYLSKNIKLLEF